MITIIIGNNEVEIENKKHHSFNNRENLYEMVKDVVLRCLYSGESISISIESRGEQNRFINSHVSNPDDFERTHVHFERKR